MAAFGLTMHLVTILRPLRRNDGWAQPPGRIAGVRRALVDRLGGVTAFTRAPAEGEWAKGGAVAHDDIITVEVMVDEIDGGW